MNSYDDFKAHRELIHDLLKQGHPPPGSRGDNTITGAIRAAADRLGIARKTMDARWGVEGNVPRRWPELAVDWSLYQEKPPSGVRNDDKVIEDETPLIDRLRALLLTGRKSVDRLSTLTRAPLQRIDDTLDELVAHGANIQRNGDFVEMVRVAEPSFARGAEMVIESDENNRYKFGVSSDKHVASKYCRLDVITDLYQRFADRGITHVLDGGNWIEGESRFNKYDTTHVGVDEQCKELVRVMPQHKGLTTYAVWGDDHEGWYVQREGIDMGAYAENMFHLAGRQDWVNLGYMEAHVILRNKNTGVENFISVMHPGGGSSYATSYRPQKIIEGLEGGEKPGILLIGHYHKLDPGLVRNVWYLQMGTAQDQTPFLRKKGIEVHIGGAIVECEQDPETGAIIEFTPTLRRYFNRRYHGAPPPVTNRWSRHGRVSQNPRSVMGV